MDAFCAEFPAFVAWHAKFRGSRASTPMSPDKPRSPDLQPQPSPTSSDAHRRWLENQDQHDYDDSWRSHDLEYYEMETQDENYGIETQPDVPEYYAPPTAASRQPDGPDAPWFSHAAFTKRPRGKSAL